MRPILKKTLGIPKLDKSLQVVIIGVELRRKLTSITLKQTKITSKVLKSICQCVNFLCLMPTFYYTQRSKAYYNPFKHVAKRSTTFRCGRLGAGRLGAGRLGAGRLGAKGKKVFFFTKSIFFPKKVLFPKNTFFYKKNVFLKNFYSFK